MIDAGTFIGCWLAGAILIALALVVSTALVAVGDKVPSPTPAEPTPALPDDTLIEIGDAVFTPDEASKIVDLAAYYRGDMVCLPWRGNGTGGDAA